MCKCAHFNPVSVVGSKDVVNNTIMEPSGDQMQCETQPRVSPQCSRSNICRICLQITGRGIKHNCSRIDQRNATLGKPNRRCSFVREMVGIRKRNLSLLLGRESEIVQEQIVSSAISRVMSKKGQKFRLKLMGAGGTRGMSKEVTIGAKGEKKELMSIEVFREIKKELVKSKNKMEKLCSIRRKHKVKMSPWIKDK